MIIPVKPTLLSAIAALSSLGFMHGQPHSSTVGITGFTSVTLNVGYNPVSISLLNRSAFVGAVATPTGQTGGVLTLSGEDLNFNNLLTLGKAYYLEVRSAGENAGDRFEVDVAATKASANAQVTLLASSPTNTATPIPDLSGLSVVIREHITLSKIFGGVGNVLLQGAAAAALADQVLFFDNATNSYVTYWLRVDNGGAIVEWRSLTPSDTTDYSSLPIRPGVGVFVFRQSATALTLRHLGMVRKDPYLWALPQGFSLVSQPAPVDNSFSSADMVKSNGWNGGGSATSADQVQVWNGTAFLPYWFRANHAGSVQEWRGFSPADMTNYLNTPALLHGDKAVMIHTQQPTTRRVTNLFE